MFIHLSAHRVEFNILSLGHKIPLRSWQNVSVKGPENYLGSVDQEANRVAVLAESLIAMLAIYTSSCGNHSQLLTRLGGGRMGPSRLGATLTLASPLLHHRGLISGHSLQLSSLQAVSVLPLTSAQSCVQSVTLASPACCLLGMPAFHPPLVTLLYCVCIFQTFSIATAATWLACLLYEIWKFLRA